MPIRSGARSSRRRVEPAAAERPGPAAAKRAAGVVATSAIHGWIAAMFDELGVRRRLAASILVIGAALAPAANAAELLSVKVEKDGRRYRVQSETRFDAPTEAVFTVLTDYERFHRISSVFKESRFLEPAPDGTPRVYTRMQGCVAFYCRTIERTERLETEPGEQIVVTAEPENSDFAYGWARWRFREDGETGEATIVNYEMEMEPAFFVPPLIGPFFLKRTLRHRAVDAVDRIEALAQEEAAAPEPKAVEPDPAEADVVKPMPAEQAAVEQRAES